MSNRTELTFESSPAYGFAMDQRRLTARGKERRQQLMEFAAKRFSENGYHTTSVAEIVDELAVGKGVFYWYFDSKEELFIEILKDAQLSLRRFQQKAIVDETDPVQRIEKGLHATMRWSANHRHISALFQFAATEPSFAPTLRTGQEVGVADTMRHVKEAMVSGRIKDADPFLLTHAIIGVTNELAKRAIYEQNEDPDEVARHAVQFCLHGLLV
jgi:AcrR family transcriptional regulator